MNRHRRSGHVFCWSTKLFTYLSFYTHLHLPFKHYSLVKIAFDLKKIATEFFFPLSFRERPKIKYIKSLLKSTHGKDVIFYHKKSHIFADFNVTDGMPYTDYISRGNNKSFFPLWIEISINILCDNYEFDKYSSVKIQHNYHLKI